MRTLIDLRRESPDAVFETRALGHHDGITHLVVMPLWYWHRLEVLLMVEDKSLSEITDYCLTLAGQAVAEEGWAFHAAFRELLMYYIYRHYQGYKHAQDNLANDNLDDCFTHLH